MSKQHLLKYRCCLLYSFSSKYLEYAFSSIPTFFISSKYEEKKLIIVETWRYLVHKWGNLTEKKPKMGLKCRQSLDESVI